MSVDCAPASAAAPVMPGAGGALLPGTWPLPALLLGLVLGAALQLQQPGLWRVWAYGALIGGAVVLFGCARAWARWRRARLGALLAASAMLMFAVCGLRASVFIAQALAPALEGQDIRVTGLVAAMPQVDALATRLRLEVESARWRGESVRLPPLVEVSWYGGAFGDRGERGAAPVPLVRAGERWQMTLRLKAPHGLRNPHGFDYELWLWEQGVQATGTVRAGAGNAPPLRLASTWRHPVERLRQGVRDDILQRLAGGANDGDPDGDPKNSGPNGDPDRARIAGVVAALVTGDQRAIDRAHWELFRSTAVAHLMSISGLHITLFAWLASRVVRALWRRSSRLCLAIPAPSAALLAGVALAAAYALFSGWGVPARRTVIMLASVAALQASGRRWPWPQVWLLACAAVLAFDPWALAQAGFWLSFVAVGVLFASDSRVAAGAGLVGRFYALLREQSALTLALTPLGLLLFAQISLVGFAANLLAIPWVTLLVTPLALAGALWAPLWSLAALSLQPLLAFLHWCAQWPWALLYLPAAPLWAGVAALLGGLLLALRLPWRLRLLALPWLWPALCWQPERPAPGQFELLAADVGQGSAVLVRTAGHALLYDAGPRYGRDGDAGQRVLLPLLRALGERLDLLMLSHRDADHSGGAAAVLAQQPQADLIGSLEADHALQRLRPAQPCLAGQRWQWDGVLFELLHPLAQDLALRPAPRSNAISCVLRISAQGPGAPTALLAGDIEAAQERALLERGAPLQADLLLAPHHGSKTSSSGAFLDAVRPRTAWVQAGYRNRFGHPAPAVVQRYRARGVTVIESARCGAARWSSSRPGAVACERDGARRYWQHRLPAAGAQ